MTLLPQLGHLILRELFATVFPPLTFSNSSLFIFSIWHPPCILILGICFSRALTFAFPGHWHLLFPALGICFSRPSAFAFPGRHLSLWRAFLIIHLTRINENTGEMRKVVVSHSCFVQTGGMYSAPAGNMQRPLSERSSGSRSAAEGQQRQIRHSRGCATELSPSIMNIENPA